LIFAYCAIVHMPLKIRSKQLGVGIATSLAEQLISFKEVGHKFDIKQLDDVSVWY